MNGRIVINGSDVEIKQQSNDSVWDQPHEIWRDVTEYAGTEE